MCKKNQLFGVLHGYRKRVIIKPSFLIYFTKQIGFPQNFLVWGLIESSWL